MKHNIWIKKTQQEMINELEGSDRDVRGFWAFTTIACSRISFFISFLYSWFRFAGNWFEDVFDFSPDIRFSACVFNLSA